MKKLRIVVFAMLALILFSFQAHATVISWDYSISAVFTGSTFTGSGDTVTDTALTWGTDIGNGRSSLVIDPSATSGNVDTYLGGGTPPLLYWGDSVSLTHNNNPITGSSLTGTTLAVTVILDPSDPDNAALPTQSFNFEIGFEETPNVGSDEQQSDIFTVINGFPNTNFWYDDANPLDPSNLQQYFVNIFPSDDQVLSTLPNGDLGFTTLEGHNTTLPFAFTISTSPLGTIPEPATMLLFGLGLIGLAGVGRKK